VDAQLRNQCDTGYVKIKLIWRGRRTKYMAKADHDANLNAWWWRAVNSTFIWITVVVLLFLVFLTSLDPAHPTQLTQFGANQILILGFITVLLLFKYISKIKIGPVEIEFIKVIEDALNTAELSLRAVSAAGLAVAADKAQYDIALDKISEARGALKVLKERYS
jgi:hypothetical protein